MRERAAGVNRPVDTGRSPKRSSRGERGVRSERRCSLATNVFLSSLNVFLSSLLKQLIHAIPVDNFVQCRPKRLEMKSIARGSCNRSNHAPYCEERDREKQPRWHA